MSKTTPRHQWVDIAAAAQYVGVTPRTIRRRIADGTLTARRFGPRLIRIDVADLDRMLAPVVKAS